MPGWITRENDSGGRHSVALYSPCECYRYALTRVWVPDGPKLTYIMLNPSRATEAQNDPTIERCERRARAWGYGGFQTVNLFAWRETDPAKLRHATAPEGLLNDEAIDAAATWADCVLCAWGVHGAYRGAGPRQEHRLRLQGFDLFSLGLTKAGHPRHPLYVAYAEKARPWFVSSSCS